MYVQSEADRLGCSPLPTGAPGPDAAGHRLRFPGPADRARTGPRFEPSRPSPLSGNAQRLSVQHRLIGPERRCDPDTQRDSDGDGRGAPREWMALRSARGWAREGVLPFRSRPMAGRLQVALTSFLLTARLVR